MDNILFQSYNIEDRSYVAFVKREIHNLVRPYFNEVRTAEIDIVVSEMCSNLIKHAKSGELLYRLSHLEGSYVFEIICLDNSVGIKDLAHSSKDGISSKSTLGQGLGAISRLSNFSQIYTIPDWGTIVYSKCYNSLEFKVPAEKLMIRCINVAKPGELVSGDGAAVKINTSRSIIFVGDGLGHGSNAKEAVDKAIVAFQASASSDPSEIVREINAGVKKTRGLVGTVAILDHEKKKWEICGVGNISTRLQRGLEYKNYVCNNGIIGLNIPNRLENSALDAEKLQMLVLCSDGIKTRWDLIRYPSILKYDPMMIAAVIYKDHSRKTDDMTVLIVKVI
jgi:anti-sigma regulatory factor (Ser/Thr protein kinase)